MEKKYYLPEIESHYSFDQIAEMILRGHLVKKSLIWEESLPEWSMLKNVPEFKAVFAEYEKMANEHVQKALGTDAETVEKREMRKILVGYDGDNIKMEGSVKQRKNIIIALFVITILGIAGYFGFNAIPKSDTPKKEPVQNIEKINLEDLKLSSGVNKIESVKGMKIKKISMSEEDKILAEALAEIKREEAEAKKAAKAAKTEKGKEKEVPSAIEESPKKQASIFDKVSDEELRAFRKKLVSQGISTKNSTVSEAKASLGDDSEKLSDKQLSSVIATNSQSTVKYCYNQALKVDSTLRGRMEVTLHILGNGSVAKVITDTPKFKNTEMERCLDSQIKKKWKFPSFNGTITTVQIPFILSAN